MRDDVIIEVSDILNMFNINEISKLIKDQINSDYSSDPSTEILTNHFHPLYVNYMRIKKQEAISEEDRRSAERHFMTACELFLKAICDKFHLTIESEWKDDNYTNIPGLTLAMYSFFVIDFSQNIYSVLLNYITRNTQLIYKTFEGMKNKKDASTIVNKKSLPQEVGLIVSNIYDITSWILQQMTDEDFFEYINPDYLPLKLIREMFNSSIITGEFMEVIADIFNYSIPLRSDTCFLIISEIRNNNSLAEDIKNSTDISSLSE